MLIKQIIFYKKQHRTIKNEHDKVKAEVEKNRKEEEHTDRQLATKMEKKSATEAPTARKTSAFSRIMRGR